MHWRLVLIRGTLLMLLMGWASAAQAQLFFEAEAVGLQRNNDGNAQYVSGPNAVSAGSGHYGFEPGYRLKFGGVFDAWQVDTAFTQISPWSTSESGTFAQPVFFDDNANNPSVTAVPPGGNTLQFPGFLRNASLSSLAGADQSTQAEFLQAGATYFSQTESNYRDWEVNIGTSQNYHPWRLSAGFRSINFSEGTLLQMGGNFDALLTIGLPGTGLSDQAIVNAGGVLISGDGDGYDASTSIDGPDRVLYSINSATSNVLNGGQVTFSYRVYDGSWFAVDAYSKAGIFRNQMRGTVVETIAGSGNDNSVYQRTLTNDRFGAAFAGNLGFRAIVGLTDYINLTAGYEVLFLSGLALGPDQLNGVSSNMAGATVYRVQNHGNVVAHGGTLGLQILW